MKDREKEKEGKRQTKKKRKRRTLFPDLSPPPTGKTGKRSRVRIASRILARSNPPEGGAMAPYSDMGNGSTAIFLPQVKTALCFKIARDEINSMITCLLRLRELPVLTH